MNQHNSNYGLINIVNENQIKKSKLKDSFLNTCEVLKSLGDYKHFLFCTGPTDNATFEIDPNVGEFTVDALRLVLILYNYYYPQINFPVELLGDNIDGNVFTFADGKFHPEFINQLKLCIENDKEFIFPFLPRIGSSHWYTFCVQPIEERIVILNPLKSTSDEEKQYIENLCNNLISKILNKLYYDVLFVDTGLQTSKMSCGESTLMIALSIITNGEKGYANLINYFENDNLLKSILDVYDISLNKKCTCINCNDSTQEKIIEKYKLCLSCKFFNDDAIKLNKFEEFKCIYCGVIFNIDNYDIVLNEKSINKLNSELSIRNELLQSVEYSSLDNLKKGCGTSEELKKTKLELELLKTKYENLLNSL